jgi:aminotransferase
MSITNPTLIKSNTKQVTKKSLAPPSMSSTVSGIEVSMIKRMQLMALKDPEVISLAQGIPSFDTPSHISDAAKKAIDGHLVDKYTPGYGIEPLREAIAEKVTRDNNIVTKAAEVLVTHGGIEALMTIFLTIMNPSDELIIITPDYASHITQARIIANGRMPVCVPLIKTLDGWKLDPQKIEEAITEKSKAILICNPCNPTGKVYTRQELTQLIDIANKYNLFIITDEMYEYFTYEGKEHISIASLPGAKNRTISAFGLSKSYAMTGWRIGYIVAPEVLIDNMMKIHDSLVTCPTVISQYAAIAAITGPQDCVADFKKAYEHRRKIVVDALKSSDKLHLIPPEGAYYGFMEVRPNIDDVMLTTQLIQGAKVAVVPGSSFGKGGASHIRISFGCDEIKLQEAMQRLIKYVNICDI